MIIRTDTWTLFSFVRSLFLFFFGDGVGVGGRKRKHGLGSCSSPFIFIKLLHQHQENMIVMAWEMAHMRMAQWIELAIVETKHIVQYKVIGRILWNKLKNLTKSLWIFLVIHLKKCVQCQIQAPSCRYVDKRKSEKHVAWRHVMSTYDIYIYIYMLV